MAEIEAKFYLTNMPALETRLKSLRAQRKKPRVHEYNVRFDMPDYPLTKALKVLRLRKNDGAWLTYKGPGRMDEGVRVRDEIEFSVGDFDAAHAFFEALGYETTFIYEKYRTTYFWADTEIVLDETPLGNFAEIEAPSGRVIQEIAGKLSLDWVSRVNDSYLGLFNKARVSLKVDFRDMTFDNFASLTVPASALAVRPADH